LKINVPGCLAIAIHDRRWFALRLRPTYDLRQKAGASDIAFNSLREMGYDSYLPRRRIDCFNRRLRVMAEWSEPLLPGYMFIVHPRPGGAVDNWDEVRSLKEVLGPLGGADGPLRIPQAVIETLMAAEFSSAYDDTAAGKRFRGESDRDRLGARFRAGEQFIVTDGPFTSFLAVVDELTHDGRVRALVDIFNRQTPVEFEPGQLEKAPQRSGTKAA
jgi:transcriptional antiterminator NusG